MREFVINGKEERVLNVLRRFGFNGYESRVYFTLLLLGRSKALTLARKSGVPFPRVYDTVYSLADKQLVEIVSDKPKEYEAAGIEYLVKHFIREKKWEMLRAVKDGEELRNMVERLGRAVSSFNSVRTPIRIFTPRYRRARVYDEDGL